ncbi:uncharacterized protein LAESUDRAFT_726637 [Laetiporus sulphureus 93-53]|uniref:Peptidase S1 domain-containing protein n=1 Tax=Laetiporus sulphureus 93-53 TaxID=1314785 RepID=A0A165DVH1_9APHY|nr:uncharacterized protein LAESUDRAFT_726637 [Laetiporus sulphureus 93-53]KZT05709.1 hypothetical protein LAESUDRAFT_726637 [Laetiporus sulphureus 93-53]
MASNTSVDLNDFFVCCIAIAAQQAGSQSPVSPVSTFSTHGLDEDVQDIVAPESRLSDSYPAAFTDFYGLPSNPPCVFKTGDAWPVRMGPEAQRILREARPVCEHPIQDRWLDIGQLICEHLDSREVKWSSIDPVRFAEAGQEDVSALYLWIGIIPGTLIFEAAKVAAEGCKDILAREGFPDVEVAFRESVVTQSIGPKLLSFDPSVDPVPELRSPFTPALGIQIAPLKTPHYEGTGAVYLRESSQSNRVFLLTAGHVARPPPTHCDPLLSRKHSSQACQEIVVLGTDAYTDAINRMMSTIGHELLSIKTWDEELERLGAVVEGEALKKTRAREDYEDLVAKARRRIEDVNEIHDEVTKNWTTPNQRVIGYVVHAPAIAVDDGPKHFTRDWALIDLYRDKIDWDTFQGNKVYVGGKISAADFILKMHPHPEGRSDFKYPPGGLLQVRGVVKDDEIRKPQQLDANGEKCLIVVKNGKTTGTTLGRLAGMESFVRRYPEHGIKKTSIEIAVYPYSNKDGAFSARGDSGAIVVDSKGRVVGLLVGGAGTNGEFDVTYLTPYWWIEKQMKKVFPNCFLYEIVD